MLPLIPTVRRVQTSPGLPWLSLHTLSLCFGQPLFTGPTPFSTQYTQGLKYTLGPAKVMFLSHGHILAPSHKHNTLAVEVSPFAPRDCTPPASCPVAECISRRATGALALALACPITPWNRNPPTYWPTQTLFQPAAYKAHSPKWHTAACCISHGCSVRTWNSLGSLSSIFSVEEIFPLPFLTTLFSSHYGWTWVAVHGTQSSHVHVIQELIIPICAFSLSLSLSFLCFCYVCVRKFCYSVIFPSASVKKTNTFICLVLCSVRNDFTYTSLF